MREDEADDVRHRTLVLVTELLKVLAERHGPRSSLGEMLAIYAGMAHMVKKDKVTISELAEATGLPKQNISRWVQKRVGESIGLRVNEDDQRVNDLVMLDRNRGQENIERLAKTLGLIDEPE
jgi:DNA-binding transcriptional ArsR family regulator